MLKIFKGQYSCSKLKNDSCKMRGDFINNNQRWKHSPLIIQESPFILEESLFNLEQLQKWRLFMFDRKLLWLFCWTILFKISLWSQQVIRSGILF